MGRTVQRVLQSRILAFWPDVRSQRVLGCGYTTPYLEPFLENAERVITMMPSGQGADHWPPDKKNIVCLCDEGRLPLETNSIDRILLIHNLECCDDLQATLRESWRVLKANGRILVIVPNRTGFWARADWSPFGQGSPFSLTQICFYLRDNLFVQERTESALFMPPIRWGAIMRSALVFEKIGRSLLGLMAGVHIIEASKQLYAGVDKKGSGSPVFAKTKELLAGKPVLPVPQNFKP
jgi:SAM-dependent methyltransferase